MPTLNINGNLVVQTAAQWAADATIYSAKKILITSDATYSGTDQRKFKIADGTQTWSNLDYFGEFGTTAGTYLQGNAVRRISLTFACNAFNPADSTTYHLGPMAALAPNIASNARFRSVAKATGTITSLRLTGNYTVGSNQSVTWELHNITAGTSVQLTTTFDMSTINSVPVTYSFSLACTLNDELELRMVCPTWTPTNPSTVQFTADSYINIS